MRETTPLLCFIVSCASETPCLESYETFNIVMYSTLTHLYTYTLTLITGYEYWKHSNLFKFKYEYFNSSIYIYIYIWPHK